MPAPGLGQVRGLACPLILSDLASFILKEPKKGPSCMASGVADVVLWKWGEPNRWFDDVFRAGETQFQTTKGQPDWGLGQLGMLLATWVTTTFRFP